MPTKYYPAVAEFAEEGPNGENSYSIFFPDLPGCTSAGRGIQEATTNAIEALALHIAGMIEDKDAIPEPSAINARLPDWAEEVDEAFRFLAPVEMPGKVVRVNITLDEGLLSRLDAAAAADGASRSGFISTAVREVLRGRAA